MPSPPADSPDQETIARAIAGEAEAFGELYDRYLDPLYRFIRFQVTLREDAEDLTETVFLKAFERLPEFRTDKRMTNFRAWIFRIARNLVIDHYRSRKPPLPLDPEMPSGNPGDGPEFQVQFREQSERIGRAVERLEEPFRPVIVMRFVAGLTYTETASALGLSENYVRVIQFRALRKLKEMLEE
ncbi:MAG TPA: sigma-70 family RNA polymerase sigma factor [Anaerolineales bacterium]|nr:sigma-70 family RNA polymerase sigma factor [Anaerolineales bacterium]